MSYIYHIATSFDNRNDYFPHLRSLLERNITGLKLAIDWPTLGNKFIDTAFGSAGEELAARYAIRNTEINAVINSDIVIVALPGGNGTYFEYGLAVATSMFTQLKPRIIVYSPNISFLEGELGHWFGLDGTIVVVGNEDKLIEAVKAVKMDIFQQRTLH